MIGYGMLTTRDWPDTKLDYAAWIQFRDSHPAFRRIEEMQITNPFTKERRVVRIPGSADVLHDGKECGRFFWEDGRIYVDGPPEVLTPLARRCADALDVDFQDEDGNDL